jgi:hypothetical protein
MGLQTGTVVHTCRFRVPASTPNGNYRLVVIANGIPSEPCRVRVTNKWFKELKYEIKEKFEVVEFHKRLLDVQKLPREILDDKLIREEFELFERYEEEWLQTVRSVSAQLDEVQQMTRSFIKPEERPEVGGLPPPEIETIKPRKLSAAEAQIAQIKHAYNDGRQEKALTKEADAIRRKVHNLSGQGVEKTATKKVSGKAGKRRRK